VLHHFSADSHPTLYRALPALEDLQSVWEDKLEDSRFEIYHNALRDGLAKIRKYYCRFDEKPGYIISLGKRSIVLFIISDINVLSVLHPYFKLDYIKLAWGGPEEQAAERAAGNLNAKNWHAEAMEVIEAAVRLRFLFLLYWHLKLKCGGILGGPILGNPPRSPTTLLLQPIISHRR
jgi:hypothetical protein